MIKNIRKSNTRRRVVLSAIAITVLIFLLTTPIFSLLGQFISSPSLPKNILVAQQQEEARVSLSGDTDVGIVNFGVKYNDNEIIQEVSEGSINFAIENYPVTIETFTIDFLGRRSPSFNYTLESMSASEISREFTLNEQTSQVYLDSFSVFLRASLISLTAFMCTLFVLRFNIVNKKALLIVLYPPLVFFPYTLLGFSLFATVINQVINSFLLSSVISLIAFFLSYFIFLTANVLNTSLNVKIPLEQAAKAAQFVFSLIAAYIMLLIVFSSNLYFFARIFLIIPFFFFYTLSSIAMLDSVRFKDAMIRTFSVTLVILLAVFVLSIWPLEFIYSILGVAVIYYILLSIGLEVKAVRLQRYVWIEYAVLVALITFVIFVNGVWGINGPIF